MNESKSKLFPAWFDGQKINEALFCSEFIKDFPMVSTNDTCSCMVFKT